MGVVVDLDALGRRIEPEGFGDAFEQSALGRVLGLLTRQLRARVLHRRHHDLALLAARRHADLDLVIRLDGQRFGDKRDIPECPRSRG